MEGRCTPGTAQTAGGQAQLLCEQQAQFRSNPRGGTARLPCLFVLPALPALLILPARFALPALSVLLFSELRSYLPMASEHQGPLTLSPKGKDQTPAAVSNSPALLQIQTSSPHTMLEM